MNLISLLSIKILCSWANGSVDLDWNKFRWSWFNLSNGQKFQWTSSAANTLFLMIQRHDLFSRLWSLLNIHYNCVQSFFGLMFHWPCLSIWYCHFWQAILLCEPLVLLAIAFYRADSLLNSHCWPKPPTHTKQHRPIECYLIKSIGSQSGRCVNQLSEKGGAN